MKIKLYTKTHNPKFIENNLEKFTSEERSYVSKKENFYKDLDTLLKNNPQTIIKEKLLNTIIHRAKKGNYRNILSIGSGNCVDEWRLKKCLGINFNITASDYDTHLISQSKVFFPEIKIIFFDFEKSDLSELKNDYDLIYFSRSLYVLDDQEFVILLKAIKKAGVKEIIDLHGGIQKKSDPLRIIIKDSVKTFFRPFNFEIRKKGKFHGYSRSEKDLIALYEKCGWNVSQKIENCKNQEILFVLN